jgi:hypothetical protein
MNALPPQFGRGSRSISWARLISLDQGSVWINDDPQQCATPQGGPILGIIQVWEQIRPR